MSDIQEKILELMDLFDDDEVTTADKINRPEPKQSVKEIELFNEFNIRNPKADGGMLVQPSADGSRPGYAKPKQKFTTPKGYVTAAELAEELGLSVATLKKYRTKGATVDKYPLKGFIEKTFKPFKGKSSATGTSTYYLKPTKKMLNDYQNFKNRTTISRDLLKDVETLHNSELIKNLRKSKKKVLPTLDQVVEVLGKDVKAHGRAANAMSVLSKMYQGEEYRLLKLPKNEETGKFIFKALRKGGKFNPYKAAFYNLAIEEIDKTLGNEVGTLKNFKRYFKDNLTKYLGKGHGVSLNEVASISGMVSNNMAPYGAFVDLTNSKINKGLLANFQGTLTNALTEIDKLKGREKLQAINAFNKKQIPNFKKQIADKYGKKIADNIRFTEIVPGTKLTNTYKPEDLAKYKTQGIDLQSLARTKGYYLDVKGAKPYTEFLENKKLTKSGKTNAMRSLIKLQNLVKQIKAKNVKGVENALKQTGVKGSNAGFISRELLESAAKGIGNVSRVLAKYGILPEVGFLGGDYLVRTQLGDSPKEAFLRASDFYRPGDQTKEAEILETSRFFGDKAGQLVGRVIDYEKQLAKIENLKQQKQSLENLTPTSNFSYLPDTSQDIKNIDDSIKQATIDLNNKFNMTEAERTYANRIREETDDARMATSNVAKTRLKRSQSPNYRMSAPQAMKDMKSQTDLDLNMFPSPATIAILDPEKGIQYKNLSESSFEDLQNYRQLLKNFNVEPPPTKLFLGERDRLRGMLPSEAAEEFGAEQAYGASGTFFGQPLAGGGIAKIAGVDQGPPPKSGPNSQGLKGLFNRVKRT